MNSPLFIECLFLFSLFLCPCSSYINSKYTLQLQCTPRPVQLHVCSSIGGGVEGGVLCFIVVLFLHPCVGITTRTVLWPLDAMSGCVSYKYFLPRQLFACL